MSDLSFYLKYLKHLARLALLKISKQKEITDNNDVIAITHKAAEEKSLDTQNKIQKLWDAKINEPKN